MAINQFAKITPLVNSDGELLQVNGDGSLKEPIKPYESNGNTQKLKNNELGILYNKNNLVIMKNGKLEIFGDYTFTMEEFLKYVADNNTNTDHPHDGEIISVIDKTTGTSVIYVIDSTLPNGYRVVNDHIVRCIYKELSTLGTIKCKLDNNGNKTKKSDLIEVCVNDSILNNMEYFITRISFLCGPGMGYTGNGTVFNGTVSIVTKTELPDIPEFINTIATFDINETSTFYCTDVVNIYRNFIGPIYLQIESNDMPTGENLVSYIAPHIAIEYMIA